MRNIPGPWTGPLAGVDNVGVTSVKTTTTQVAAPVAPARPAVDQSALFRPPSPAPTLPADKFRELLSPPVAPLLLSLPETTLSGSKLLNSTLNTRALMTEQQLNKI